MKRIAVLGPITLAPLMHLLDGSAAKRGQDYSHLGLGGSQITQLVEELVRRGYQVLACSTEKTIKTPVYLYGTNLKILFVPYQKPVKRLLSLYRSERRTMANAVRNFSPDMAHAHWSYEFALAALDTKLPHLITVRDHPLQVLREMHDKRYRAYRLLVHCLVVYKAKAFTANSPVTAKTVPNKKLKAIIPNGISPQYKCSSIPRRTHRGEIIVCSIGSGEKSKNIRSLIDAVNAISERGYSIKLHLVGPGLNEGSPIHDYVRSVGREKHVCMMGVVSHDKAVRLIASANLYVHPSKLESFGNPVVESMLVGTPCMVPKVGQGPEWILQNGRYGTIADGTDTQDFKSALLDYLIDPSIAESKAALAMDQAETEFSISSVTDRYLDIYEQVTAIGCLRAEN